VTDPYAAARPAERREHTRRWDAAAKALGIDPNTHDPTELDRIRAKYKETR
jgi:hypothetical protein